ncbi:hypothetical protein BJF83_22705 [Nocardiopsis sp. CNR-923]|uniref:SDR family NAD(P)-dependent oxidoreductase n=1 Tax=Nocardiopsis sp. CNR-923 TaxID=1904965 RepID=UPI0009672D20|nr:SDR family NAD(P)-dependent oxidoreductase [Nocardiopsis sp. CNR-923]OLT25754.1 hypothetical protein BJF83_22705 [Nocardiopsis sp. CNR-923]
MAEKDIAVLGMDCRFPGASDYREFWANLTHGEDSITEVPSERWDWRAVFGDPEAEPGRTNSRWGGFVADIGGFDPLFFGMSPKQARFVDPQQRIALESAWSAIEDAGYAASDLAGRRTGVYVGVSKNDYAELMREHKVPIPSYVSTGTVHSIIANRISFLFDLKGRSSVVDTACSSSLVALHDAIRDLRLGECETALVGGVNALLSPTMYISHAQSGMLSADGRCKVFDADANGYVRGEGVAFVLLKPLDRALADGDRVVGVIKGSAVNHSGRGNSLTTPSVTGQAEVITAALKDAAVDSDSIGYVEAHGTGTALGDPIEIRALTEAFSEQGGARRPQPCPIGAVKTNIGHLESASGIAGLLKVLLMLRHHRIPPSLHLERPNPYIDFDATPFSPVREGRAWTGLGSLPRRAGLSAFGMGGVNAHVVVEEAPVTEADPEPRRPVAPQVIPLSAKSEAALTRMRIRLREFLRGPGAELDIHDIAFTLQVGRASLPHRAAWLASGVDELVKRLDIDDEPEVAYHGSTSQATAAPREETAPASRARQWVQGRFDDWRAAGPVPEGRRVALPTYPFDRSWYWFEEPAREQRADADDHGAVPEQSVSEVRGSDYFVRDHVVAGRTVVPGVAYFELVRRQAQARFGRTPMSFRDVHWLRVLEVGEQPLALRVDWEERDGGAAFEVKLDDTVYALGEIRFEASELPELTAPASQWLSRVEAVDGLYERFAAYGLEYGPSFRVIDFCRTGTDEALCRVQRREPENGTDALELEPSLLDGAFQSAVALSLFGTRGSDDQYVPFALGSFDLYSPLPAAVNVHVIERDTVKEVRQFDIVLRDDAGTVVARMEQLQKRPHRPRADKPAERLELSTEWVDEPLAMHGEAIESVVLFSDDDALRKSVEYTIGAGRVIGVGSGETLEQSPEGDYRVDRHDPRQLAALFERLAERNAGHRIVLHTDSMSPTTDPGDLEVLLGIAQGAVRLRHLGPIRVVHVHPDTSDAPFGALIGGFARTLAYETPDVSVLSVGVEDTEETPTEDIVRNELSHYDHAPLREVAYRGGRRLVRVVRELPVQGDPGTSLFRPGGTYVLSGGAGGIGRVLSRHLAHRYGAELVWLGRSPQDAAIDAELAATEEIGGRARYFACDVSNESDVRQVFGELERAGVTVNGVIHAAGLIDDSFIQRMSPESVRRVLAPKVHGALALDRAAGRLPLDLFIVFSSIAAVMPNQGQGAYAAANGFLDSFAAHRQTLVDAGERSGRSLSIAWPLWRDGGIQVGEAEHEHLVEAFGMEPIRDDTGIEILEQCARQPQGGARTPGHIIVAEGDGDKLRTHLRLRPGRWGTPAPRPLERADAVLERIIAPGLEKGLVYDAGRSYDDLGLDSMHLVDLASRLAVAFGREVSPTDLFEHPTPQGTATWLAREPRPVPSLIERSTRPPTPCSSGRACPPTSSSCAITW